ncbi:MAG: integrase arm-type DNA-binding domain-containing protein [Gammaproteobacteria bacterium]|nr:integrase arm-type DNA-binding domain-containing protein [Gammaproteobacteria bacterium]
MKLKKTRISRRTVEALRVEKDTVFWDSELPGFGVRVYPTGNKFYVVQTRTGGKAGKRVTVGRHGVITADEARRRAAGIIARVKAGEEPSPEPSEGRPETGPTIGELAGQWLDEHVEVRCKPNTRTMYRRIVNNYILPALGKEQALSVDRARVADLHHSMRSTPAMANSVVKVLSRIWRVAEDRGRIPEGRNPCRMLVKFRTRKRERFLSEEEFRRLGNVLTDAETAGDVSVHAIAAIRLLLLTGCRKNEILTLKWDEVDLEAGELQLPDSKTGARTIPISPEAAGVMVIIPRRRGQSPCHSGEGPG